MVVSPGRPQEMENNSHMGLSRCGSTALCVTINCSIIRRAKGDKQCYRIHGFESICCGPWPAAKAEARRCPRADRKQAAYKVNKVILFSFATASISFTVTETKLFSPVRAWIKGRSTVLGKLFSCGYCLGRWVALALVAANELKLF